MGLPYSFGIFIAVLILQIVHIFNDMQLLEFELKAVGMNKFASAMRMNISVILSYLWFYLVCRGWVV